MRKSKLLIRLTFTFLTALIFISASLAPDEGMFPLSEIKNLDLKKMGMQLDQNDIFNPQGISLTDALVSIGGCTGSFISDKGLILTNHHCAFGAIQLASTPEHDYLKNGFVAPTFAQEIEGKGLTCRITESYEDVSDRILSATAGIMDPLDRIKTINSKIQQIVKEEEAKEKGIKAEVSEMFIGKRYVLFRYKTIKDVRLVYIPRITIGEFGGEADNWVWPRHTGDYSFVRAYVAPDGSPAPYSPGNVPYKPKKFIKINANGVNEEDFVFILGYPQRTYRHRPSQFLEYQDKFILPYVANLLEYQNQQMLLVGSTDKAIELKQATRVKRNANLSKNYRGKIQGLSRIELIEQKRQEEKDLQNFINGDPKLKDKYGSLLSRIDGFYKEMSADAQRDIWFQYIFPSSCLLNAANHINNLVVKLNEVEKSKRNEYLIENKARLHALIETAYQAYVEETDKRLLNRMILDALKLPENQRVPYLDAVIKNNKGEKGVQDYIDKLFKNTLFKDEQSAYHILDMSWDKIVKLKDPMLTLADELNNQLIIITQTRQKREGQEKKLMADFVDVKSLFKKAQFIPDANNTIRLTYGFVRGYTPADGVYHSPFTTLKGVIEKSIVGGEFEMPSEFKELYKKKDYGVFKQPKLNDIPVAFLYNLDTSSGTSGSPVMNSKGEMVGVNFDRAFTATINDFAWNESYSRAMAVDIRYILWLAQKVDKADFILKELGVKTD